MMSPTLIARKMVPAACAAMVAMLISGPLCAQGTFGFKFWNTDYDIDGEEVADGPFLYLYYAIPDAAGNLVFQVGHGNADHEFGDVTRTDLAVAYTQSKDYVQYGAGLRGILQDFEVADIVYLGPEVMGGLSYPVGDSGFVPQLTGSLGIYYYDSDTLDETGAVFGYSLDAGVAYMVREYAVKLGYRSVAFGDDGQLEDDELSGIYLDVAFTW